MCRLRLPVRVPLGFHATWIPGESPARRLRLSPASGVSLGLWQDRDPLESLATARIADELGYPELWVGEMATWDAFALASAIARETRTIELCVGPLATAVRDPMAMAMGVASVAALARRPVHLAIGSSSQMVVERWHGRSRERTARHIHETAEALRPLLAGEKARFEGELVRTDGYRLRLPAPATSLTIAAFGEATVRVAARLADRMVLNLVTPELVSQMAQRLRAETSEPPRLAAWVVAAVDPTAETHAQLARGLDSISGSRGLRRDVHRRGIWRAGRCGAWRVPTRRSCSSRSPRDWPRRWDW